MSGERKDSLGLERVFFSDAVFAIAITLLILEVRAPHLSPDAPTVARITRRSCALPLTCGLVALAAGLGLTQAFFGFALIPLVAWFLDRAGPPRTMKRGGRSRPVASS